jgi:hypothetical protein
MFIGSSSCRVDSTGRLRRRPHWTTLSIREMPYIRRRVPATNNLLTRRQHRAHREGATGNSAHGIAHRMRERSGVVRTALAPFNLPPYPCNTFNHRLLSSDSTLRQKESPNASVNVNPLLTHRSRPGIIAGCIRRTPPTIRPELRRRHRGIGRPQALSSDFYNGHPRSKWAYAIAPGIPDSRAPNRTEGAGTHPDAGPRPVTGRRTHAALA